MSRWVEGRDGASCVHENEWVGNEHAHKMRRRFAVQVIILNVTTLNTNSATAPLIASVNVTFTAVVGKMHTHTHTHTHAHTHIDTHSLTHAARTHT